MLSLQFLRPLTVITTPLTRWRCCLLTGLFTNPGRMIGRQSASSPAPSWNGSECSSGESCRGGCNPLACERCCWSHSPNWSPCAASASVFLSLPPLPLLPLPLLSLPLKWCGQSGMDDCIGNLFIEMVFAAGAARAPFWWQQHAVEMEKRFSRQLEIPSASA